MVCISLRPSTLNGKSDSDISSVSVGDTGAKSDRTACKRASSVQSAQSNPTASRTVSTDGGTSARDGPHQENRDDCQHRDLDYYGFITRFCKAVLSGRFGVEAPRRKRLEFRFVEVISPYPMRQVPETTVNTIIAVGMRGNLRMRGPVLDRFRILTMMQGWIRQSSDSPQWERSPTGRYQLVSATTSLGEGHSQATHLLLVT